MVDAHCDTMVKVESPDDFLNGRGKCQVDLPGLEASGVSHIVMAVCTESHPGRIPQIWARGTSNYAALPRDSGKTRFHFAVEGCMPFHLGLEMPEKPLTASLTWNGDNPYGSGIGGTGGLTTEGASLAGKLHALGVFLDVSHLNDRTRRMLLALDLPVCATHCNSRKLCDVPRNLPDQDLKEIARRGGVVGITLVPDFLRGDGTGAAVSDVLRHVEHVAETAGIEAVGLGTDFDGVRVLPEGINGVRDLHQVFDGLLGLGWKREDVEKVASENWIRFFRLETEG